MKILYFVVTVLIASCSLMAMEERRDSMAVDQEAYLLGNLDDVGQAASDHINLEERRQAAIDEIINGNYGSLTPMLHEFFSKAQDSKFAGSDQDFIHLVRLAVSFNHQNVIHFLKHFHILESKLILYLRFGVEMSVIELLLQAHPDLTYNEGWLTPLTSAISDPVNSSETKVKILRLLIDAGADVNQMIDKRTPLFFAAIVADLTLIKFLLDNKADSSLPSRGSILRMACQTGKTKVVKLLLSLQGSDINYANQDAYHSEADSVSYGDYTPLSCAIFMGRLKIVKLLIDNGAAINAKDPSGWTPLMQASAGGLVKIVNLLLDRKADQTIKNKQNKIARQLFKARPAEKPHFS
jgi:ankyrin repeat protein